MRLAIWEIFEEIWDSGTWEAMCDCINKADVSNDGVSNYCSSWGEKADEQTWMKGRVYRTTTCCWPGASSLSHGEENC